MCLACADVARVAVGAWARGSSASRGWSWMGGFEGYRVSEGLMGVQGRSEVFEYLIRQSSSGSSTNHCTLQ